jgi:alkanesulfonate monooxygenase SsuD/methylene tetrahydromethanopterin reductase-like flavin-dependent oxidoreductase (luciferase family)
MEFGIFDHLDASGQPLDAYYETRLQVVEAFDRAGFYGYHLAEHHSTPLGMAPSPSVFLAAVAQRTRRLRFGPLIYALPLYHPMRLVQEICMLDQMSRGRLEIGFGRGASAIELSCFGINPAEAEAIYVESLEMILQGLATQKLDGKGKYHSFDNVPLHVAPYQKPHPPLWYGVHSPASAERAGRTGCNVVSLDSAAETRDLAAYFRTAWRSAHPAAAREPLIGLGLFVVVADTDAAALAIGRRAYPVWHTSFNWLFNYAGTTIPRHARPPEWDQMAAQGRAIAGTPRTVAAFLRRQIDDSTVNYLVSQMVFGDMTADETLRSIALFADQVMPALR